MKSPVLTENGKLTIVGLTEFADNEVRLYNKIVFSEQNCYMPANFAIFFSCNRCQK